MPDRNGTGNRVLWFWKRQDLRVTGGVKCQASQPPSPLPQRPASPAFSGEQTPAMMVSLSQHLSPPSSCHGLTMASMPLTCHTTTGFATCCLGTDCRIKPGNDEQGFNLSGIMTEEWASTKKAPTCWWRLWKIGLERCYALAAIGASATSIFRSRACRSGLRKDPQSTWYRARP